VDVEDFENEERDKKVVAKASAKDRASYGSEDRGIAEATSGDPAHVARAHAQQLLAKSGGAGNESSSVNDMSNEGAEPESDGTDEPMKHLKNINQPKDEHGSDGDPLGAGELFDTPRGPPPAKRLLGAAIKAREQPDAAERAAKGDTNKGEHLSHMAIIGTLFKHLYSRLVASNSLLVQVDMNGPL
jgi:hypothetical protein